MGGKYTSDNITQNFLMDSEERDFFDTYASALEEQEKALAQQRCLDENSYELDQVLIGLEDMKEEYLVHRASLKCSNATLEEMTVIYTDDSDNEEIITSNPQNIDEYSRIRINEVREYSINGLIPAGVSDCKGGMRDDRNEDQKVNIVSFGNCSLIKDGSKLSELIAGQDAQMKIDKIKNWLNKGMGTCYCFMKLNEEWENLALAGEYMTGSMHYGGVEKVLSSKSYMKFNGIEGINMLSMLYCSFKSGGIISAVDSGQIELDIEDRIQQYLDLIDGKHISTLEEMLKLETVEILARLVCQENTKTGEAQNAVVFSIVNRLFAESSFLDKNSCNNIYGIISAQNQYEAIYYNKELGPGKYAYTPEEGDPSWENAKRLAALLCIAIEDYGIPNSDTSERTENIVENGDEKTRELVISFLENQRDDLGDPIKNYIGYCNSFYSDRIGEQDTNFDENQDESVVRQIR